MIQLKENALRRTEGRMEGWKDRQTLFHMTLTVTAGGPKNTCIFLMSLLEKIVELVIAGSSMASIDLNDAHFTVPIAHRNRKYLRFFWQGKLHQFYCLPFGLSPAPRISTKIMKPPMTILRLMGHESADYVDDKWLVSKPKMEVEQNIIGTKTILTNLSFIINDGKSVFNFMEKLKHTGFVIDSRLMTVSFTD